MLTRGDGMAHLLRILANRIPLASLLLSLPRHRTASTRVRESRSSRFCRLLSCPQLLSLLRSTDRTPARFSPPPLLPAHIVRSEPKLMALCASPQQFFRTIFVPGAQTGPSPRPGHCMHIRHAEPPLLFRTHWAPAFLPSYVIQACAPLVTLGTTPTSSRPRAWVHFLQALAASRGSDSLQRLQTKACSCGVALGRQARRGARRAHSTCRGACLRGDDVAARAQVADWASQTRG